MLKFEALANVGDVIKAYDFKPMEGRPDSFMTGVIVDKGPIYVKRDFGDGIIREVYHCDGYTVKVIGGDAAEYSQNRIGDIGYIPFEVSMLEYDERVQLVATAEEVDMLIESEAAEY